MLSVIIPDISGSTCETEQIHLLNPFLQRKIFFYKLKTRQSIVQYFNTKSYFYTFEEYSIDRTEMYRNEWYTAQKEKEVEGGVGYSPPITTPPEDLFYFESYKMRALKQKEQVFATQPVEVLDIKTDARIKKLMDSDDAKYVELPKPRVRKVEEIVTEKEVEAEDTAKALDVPLDDAAFGAETAEPQLDADGNPIPAQDPLNAEDNPTEPAIAPPPEEEEEIELLEIDLVEEQRDAD